MVDKLCEATWPVDYLYDWQVTHGELVCNKKIGHTGLHQGIRPDTGQVYMFPDRKR